MVPLLLCVLTLVAVWTLPDYGMGWDEPTRWKSGDLKLDYYEGFAAAEDWRSHFGSAPKDTYPGLFDLPLAWAARHFGVDRFLWGHGWSFFFGAVGVLACALLARGAVGICAVTPVGALAGLMLLFLPSYYGHIFINPKDIPFAATYALALVGLMGFVSGFPRPSWLRTILFGVLVGLAVSTRLPGGVVLAYGAVLALLWLALRWLSGTGRSTWWRDLGALLGRGVVAGIVALVLLLFWWPAGHLNPLSGPVSAVGKLHTAAKAIPVLFQGEFYEAGNTPFLYLPLLLAFKLPLWSLVLGLVALALGSNYLGVHRRLAGSADEMEGLLLRRLALLLGLSFPAVYAFLLQPALHNGIRHLLYLLPPFAAVLAVAVDAIHRRLRDLPWWRGGGAWAALLLICVLGVWPLVRLHPYQYAYYNTLAGGVKGSFGRFETEYWFTSTREGIRRLDAYLEAHPAARPTGRTVRVFLSGPWQVAEPFLPDDWELTGDVSQADFILSNTQMMVHTLFDGQEIFRIERAGLPILIALRPERAAAVTRE
jgi:hypothetical protein